MPPKPKKLGPAMGRYCEIRAGHACTEKPELNIDALVGPDFHGTPLHARCVRSYPGRVYDIQLLAVSGADGFLTKVSARWLKQWKKNDAPPQWSLPR